MTIGGYGFTEGGFLGALRKAGVDTLVDIRQRRGMRGAKYAFLNSIRLQTLLGASGIKYVHALYLAPTAGVRDLQKQDDQASATAKRDRRQLSLTFVTRYSSEILESFEAEKFLRELNGSETLALFCVESHPAACHRSLAAEHLVQLLGINQPVAHLAP